MRQRRSFSVSNLLVAGQQPNRLVAAAGIDSASARADSTRRIHRSTSERPASAAKLGMTLIEVVMALSLLGGVLLAMSGFTFRLAKSTGAANITATATQLVMDQLDNVKSAKTYALVDGYKATENPVAGFPGYKRQTYVQRVGGLATDSVDYRIVTVEVTNAQLPSPLKKSTVIAAF